MRNVLEEFLKPRRSQRKPTILGLREHIFTGRSAFIITCLIIDWNLLSANGNIASQSAEKHCDFLLVYMLIFPPPPSFISVYAHVSLSLSLSPPPLPLPLLQCFVTCMVHVQSRNQFCNYWAANFGKSSQVSLKFSWKSIECLCDFI